MRPCTRLAPFSNMVALSSGSPFWILSRSFGEESDKIWNGEPRFEATNMVSRPAIISACMLVDPINLGLPKIMIQSLLIIAFYCLVAMCRQAALIYAGLSLTLVGFVVSDCRFITMNMVMSRDNYY